MQWKLGMDHDDEIRGYRPYSTVLYPQYIRVDKIYWSQKSKDELKAFASTIDASCLQNYSSQAKSYMLSGSK